MRPRARGSSSDEIGLLLMLIVAPPLARVFSLAPLFFAERRLLLLFPPVMVLLEAVRKWLARRGRASCTVTTGVTPAARLDASPGGSLMTSAGGR